MQAGAGQIMCGGNVKWSTMLPMLLNSRGECKVVNNAADATELTVSVEAL